MGVPPMRREGILPSRTARNHRGGTPLGRMGKMPMPRIDLVFPLGLSFWQRADCQNWLCFVVFTFIGETAFSDRRPGRIKPPRGGRRCRIITYEYLDVSRSLFRPARPDHAPSCPGGRSMSMATGGITGLPVLAA
jgi:hypothetical protein